MEKVCVLYVGKTNFIAVHYTFIVANLSMMLVLQVTKPNGLVTSLVYKFFHWDGCYTAILTCIVKSCVPLLTCIPTLCLDGT